MDGSIPAPVYTPEGDYNLYFPLVTGGAMPQTGRMVEPPPHTEWRTYYTLGGLRAQGAAATAATCVPHRMG